MWYIVDGYNLMFRNSGEGKNFEARREGLIELLVIMSHIYNLTVVFDAQNREDPQVRTHIKELEIIFTDEGKNADDTICEMVESASNQASCTVVTSDNQLAWRVRQLRAKTLSVEAFSKLPATKKQKRSPPEQSPRKAHLSQEDPEFNRWLNIFEDRWNPLP